MYKKVIASVVIAALILNMILFAVGMIDILAFWVIIAAGAGIAYFGFKK